MLSLQDRGLDRNCQGFTRREFLRVGGFGGLGFLGSLTLPQLLAAKAQASGAGRFIKDRSVVFLFLQGGPSHIETFDPKMTAPSEYRSVTGEARTCIPGLSFGGTFPKLGRIADKFSIVRSYASGNGGHTYLDVMSARNPLKATMSALYARVAGTNHPESSVPRNVLLKPEAVEKGLKLGSNFETGALPTLFDPGRLGPVYQAFDPSGGGELHKSMQLRLTPEQFADRRQLLAQLDGLKRQLDYRGVMDSTDRFQQQAFDVITRGVADAFDLSKEDAHTVARYDTSKLFDIKEVQKWGDMRRSSNLLGKQLLLARRLCEAGCGFVTVSDCGWDMHSNNNSPKNLGGMKWLGAQVDHAVAAFIEDVRARGLEDKILLVVTGEMGRTPRINKNGGRDHYGNLTPLLLFGGGVQPGRVIGQSDANASRPATEPITPKHLMGTIMHSLLEINELRLETQFGQAGDIITTSTPIPGLM